MSEYSKKYYYKHRKDCIKGVLKWQKENPEKTKEYDRKYYRSHKKEINEKQRKHYAKLHPNAESKRCERHERNWEYASKKTLERDNFTCQKCGSKLNVEVHHKDGTGRSQSRQRKEMNNNPDNLITLCHRCHILEDLKRYGGNFHHGENKGGCHKRDERRDNKILEMSKNLKQIRIVEIFGITKQRVSQIILRNI